MRHKVRKSARRKTFGNRKSIPRSKSRRLFTRTAKKTKGKNMRSRPMRGGIRL